MSDLHSQFNIIITRAVESSINTYAELISKKFNLNSSEIKNIWYNSEFYSLFELLKFYYDSAYRHLFVCIAA